MFLILSMKRLKMQIGGCRSENVPSLIETSQIYIQLKYKPVGFDFISKSRTPLSQNFFTISKDSLLNFLAMIWIVALVIFIAICYIVNPNIIAHEF